VPPVDVLDQEGHPVAVVVRPQQAGPERVLAEVREHADLAPEQAGGVRVELDPDGLDEGAGAVGAGQSGRTPG
jgi:hypothetical protein